MRFVISFCHLIKKKKKTLHRLQKLVANMLAIML